MLLDAFLFCCCCSAAKLRALVTDTMKDDVVDGMADAAESSWGFELLFKNLVNAARQMGPKPHRTTTRYPHVRRNTNQSILILLPFPCSAVPRHTKPSQVKLPVIVLPTNASSAACAIGQ